MDNIDWTAIAAFVAAGVGLANIMMTTRVARQRQTATWARERLPLLIEEFWTAASQMEDGLKTLREAGDVHALADAHSIGMDGFRGMIKVVQQMELEAPSDIGNKAVLYMDALDAVRVNLLEAGGSKGQRTLIYRAAMNDQVAARQELINACRAGMGLDEYSVAGINKARSRSFSVYPRIEKRHRKALARMQAAMRRGPRWWVR